jgi:threonine dehydrogenase-like Zn-dependent dehydrogenase
LLIDGATRQGGRGRGLLRGALQNGGLSLLSGNHRLPLQDAPDGYRIFRDKENNCVKVVLEP